MGLIYPGQWKFEGSGIAISRKTSREFYELVKKIANGRKDIVEGFKRAFGDAGSSSNYDWALADMDGLFEKNLDNAAQFIDCFWSGVERAKELGVVVPDENTINRILSSNDVPLQIQLPNLVQMSVGVVDPATVSSKEDCIPTYELLDELGKGGYGVVYRAIKETTVSSFEFALKMLDPSPFVSDYDKAVRRFSREIEALKALQHRSIVPIIEAGLTADSKPYIVMPLIKGKHLRDALATMSYEETIRVFLEILSGLAYAHQNDVIHRDLKPNNILVRDTDSQPVIIDFGASFILDQQTTESLTTHFTGTLGYIPSEVIADPKRRSHLHDIYSVGIMLYECIAHCKPDPANYKSLSELDAKYLGLDAVIINALAGENARTQSTEMMKSELQRLI